MGKNEYEGYRGMNPASIIHGTVNSGFWTTWSELLFRKKSVNQHLLDLVLYFILRRWSWPLLLIDKNPAVGHHRLPSLWNPMEKWRYSPHQLVSRISSIVCRPWLVFQGGDFPYNGLQYIGIIPSSSSTFQRYPAAKFGHFLGDPQWKSCHPTLMSSAKRPCPCFSRVSSLALASYPNAVRTWRYERLAPVVGCAKRKRKVRSGQTWAKGKHTGSRWRGREIEKDCIQRRTP